MRNKLFIFIIACIGMSIVVSGAEKLVVAALNPIAGNLAAEVGGDRVRIIQLMDASQDPHSFSPNPSDLRAAGDARIFLAMGKGLETYLPDLRDALRDGQSIFEIGRMIPSLRMNRTQEMFACCDTHGGTGGLDPHWWQSPPHVRKAVLLVAERFSAADPAGAKYYGERAAEYAQKLDDLHAWTQRKIRTIPRSRRKLATAHAAFNYLCSEYGIEPLPINGLSTMEEPKPAELAAIIATIRRERIPAVFPEATSSNKVLEAMVRETGVEIGNTLYAGTLPPENPCYLQMMRHNVEAIVSGLNSDEGQ